MPKYRLFVNKAQKEVEVDGDTPLLYVLRNNLELNGPKFGCGLSQCGACMALIDGEAKMTCMLPVSLVGTSEVITLDGLVDEDGTLHPVQEAIIEEQAAQCGYCINGMIVSAASLLKKKPEPNIDDIRRALQPNLCRCGTHSRIIKAVQNASSK